MWNLPNPLLNPCSYTGQINVEFDLSGKRVKLVFSDISSVTFILIQMINIFEKSAIFLNKSSAFPSYE